MARTRKKGTSPSTVDEITAPKALTPLMQAFHVNTEEARCAFTVEAVKTLFGYSESGSYSAKDISKEELEGVLSLMKGLNPSDSLETLYAAQIVASHVLGMRKLSTSYPNDQKLGLKLLRFSNEAMQWLNRKRSGETKNITVNYNYQGD